MSTPLEESHFHSSEEAPSRCCICDGKVISFSPFANASTVIHCQNCHTESIRPLPTPAQLDDYYANYVATKTSEEQLQFLISLSIKALRFYLQKTALSEVSPPQIRFLEIGFGNGAGLFAGAKLGWQSYGIDLDPVCVANAKVFANKHSLEAQCLHGEVASLVNLETPFDLVKASQVLEHVLNPVEFLSAIARAQPTGGYLIIESPNNQAAFWRLKNRVRQRFDRANYYNSLKLQEHLWGYTRKGLPLLLEKAGYRTLFVRDYAAGNAIFEPQSVLWYATLRSGIRAAWKHRALQPLLYPSVRAFDALASRLLHQGTGLAALCQKVEA
ncbi:MAG: class I SAM-dependent methyltransferase [Acidobacteria bacterium]|nr:class I SAM-dependent methyltransferase [Acidobacteriota bacterium]